MNTRYTHNTLDVGAAISACYVIWNNPSLVSYILGAFHAITAYFGVIGTFDSGFDDTLFQAGLCAVGSLYGLLSGKHYNHCWPIHESLPEALIQLVQEQYVSEIPDSLLEILCSTGTEMSNW